MKRIEKEIVINASKEATWDLLFNRFGEVNNFNPLIEGSHHHSGEKGEVGCERQCQLSPTSTITEKITGARGNDSFDIDIVDGGLPMMDEMKATFNLEAIGSNKTKITFVTLFSTKPGFMAGLMKGMVENMLFKMLIGLKFHLETGELVDKENSKNIFRMYKKLPVDGQFSGIAQAVA